MSEMKTLKFPGDTEPREVADAKAREELGKLSAGIANQVTPESFGAQGDGVTDDTDSIMRALASGRSVVFDGTKTYVISSTITVPAKSCVDFRGATLIPAGNFDVIRVKPGACIQNLIVKCSDVSDWDSSVLVFYAGDMFRASDPTRISNVKLYNDTSFNDGTANAGNGLYLYADDFGQIIEGLSVADALTCGFGRGILIRGLDDSLETLTNKAFIGANNFRGYWSYRDTYGIYIDAKLPNNNTTNNFFTDLNIQSDYYGGSVYAIYCNGYANYFSGCLYDYSILSYHPATAVYFDVGSNYNVVEVTDGVINKPGYCVNLGGFNKVERRCFENEVQVPYGMSDIGMIGNQDDALAFMDKRANCTLESLDGDPYKGDLSSVFDPTPNNNLVYRALNPDANDRRAIITINCKTVLARITHFILQFGRQTPPKSVKVTLYNATDATVIYSTKTNANRLIVISPAIDYLDYVLDVAKIVIELGGFNLTKEDSDGEVYGEWSIGRIMAVDSYHTGNAWLRRDGGEMYGNIKFPLNNGPVLTDASGKRYLLTVSTDGTLSTAEMPEEEEETPEIAALTPTMAAGTAWYDTDLAGAEQTVITSVVFNSGYEPTGNEDASWACDADGNGNIMAYRNGTEVIIKSTTGSDGVKLNTDSSYMFANDGTNANFAALASITGTETWEAESNTSIARICQGNTVMTSPISVPDGVVDMTRAFSGCTALTAPPELPEGLTSISNAFSECAAMQVLPEVPSTVTNMEYAFHGCKAATKAPAVIPARVMKMLAAFRNCNSIDGTIEVNAASLTSYERCFENACKTSGAIVLTGSCPMLADLAATNTEGKVTVAG